LLNGADHETSACVLDELNMEFGDASHEFVGHLDDFEINRHQLELAVWIADRRGARPHGETERRRFGVDEEGHAVHTSSMLLVFVFVMAVVLLMVLAVFVTVVPSAETAAGAMSSRFPVGNLGGFENSRDRAREEFEVVDQKMVAVVAVVDPKCEFEMVGSAVDLASAHRPAHDHRASWAVELDKLSLGRVGRNTGCHTGKLDIVLGDLGGKKEGVGARRRSQQSRDKRDAL